MDDHGYAHELAKELGVDVIAPNDKAWADRRATPTSRRTCTRTTPAVRRRSTPKRKSPDTGAWRRFSPGGEVKLELAPGAKLGRTAALTLLTRTLPRTEGEIRRGPRRARAFARAGRRRGDQRHAVRAALDRHAYEHDAGGVCRRCSTTAQSRHWPRMCRPTAATSGKPCTS